MLRFALIGIVLAGAACSGGVNAGEAKPAVADVDRLEGQLVELPCIGALDQWSRQYGFADAGADRNRIVFKFDQAGIYNYRVGRTIVAFIDGLDERARRLAYGEYDLSSGRVFIRYCGSNRSPVPPAR